MSVADPPVSVQVVFLPAGDVDRDAPITAATLAAHAPDPRSVDDVAAHLRRAGFEVGRLAGISLTASARRSVIERTFGVDVTVEQAPDGSVRRASVTSGEAELPLEDLPPQLRAVVGAITFGTPPAFGPGAGP